MTDNKQSTPSLHITPQPSLKIGRSERTRTAILNVTLDFIWTHSFRDMTVNSLMTLTGVGHLACYQYFRDLHEVMEALLLRLQEEIFVVAEPWFTGVDDSVPLMHDTFTGLVRVRYQLFMAASGLERQPRIWYAHESNGEAT